jgi:hypothetical protein
VTLHADIVKECNEGWCIDCRTKTDREYWVKHPTLSESLGNLQEAMSTKKERIHLYLHIDFSICKSLDLDATQIKAKITSHLMS